MSSSVQYILGTRHSLSDITFDPNLLLEAATEFCSCTFILVLDVVRVYANVFRQPATAIRVCMTPQVAAAQQR